MRAKAGRKRRSYHHGDLRRALLEAAHGIVAESGPRALSLREVARRIGVSQTALYHHFADKEELLATLAHDGFVALRETMVVARDAARPNAGARLTALGIGYARFAVEHPSALRVMFGGEVEFPKHEALVVAARAAFATVRDGVIEAQRADSVRRGDPSELALLAWSMMHGFATLWLSGAATGATGLTTPFEPLARSAAETIVRGLSM